MYAKKEKIYSANGKGCEAKSERWRWHYLAVKTLSALLRGVTSKKKKKGFLLSELSSFF